MYEHTIGVPMVMAGPNIPAGKRFAAQMYLRDLYPTICELAGVPIPETVEGRSVVPVLSGKTEAVYPHVFGYFRNVQRMIRTDRWKLICYPHLPRYQLFDLQADRWELQDLSADPGHADVLAELRAKLEAWQREVGDPLLKADYLR
jgi:arylsulfatase A-like enzyme